MSHNVPKNIFQKDKKLAGLVDLLRLSLHFCLAAWLSVTLHRAFFGDVFPEGSPRINLVFPQLCLLAHGLILLFILLTMYTFASIAHLSNPALY